MRVYDYLNSCSIKGMVLCDDLGLYGQVEMGSNPGFPIFYVCALG